MKPVMQTTFYPGGDCFNACVASILEVELADMPEYNPANWFPAMHGFLLKRGLGIIQFDFVHVHFLQFYDGVFYIMNGQSPRHDCKHSVVACMEEVVHDPHPEGTGILGDPTSLLFLVTSGKSFIHIY